MLIIYNKKMFGSPEYDSLLDAFKCEICGIFFSGLSHHISGAHGITVREYKRRFGLNQNTSLVTESEKKKHAERCKKLRTFDKMDPAKISRFKKGDNTRQKYERSAQTKRFLRLELAKKGREAIRRKNYRKRHLTKTTKVDNMG